MQRLSRDIPSPRALPLLLGSSEPGTLCGKCCPRVSWAPGRPAPSRQSAAEAAFGEAGRGSKTGPAWGSRALPTPPGREEKPRRKDRARAPTPEAGLQPHPTLPGCNTLCQGPGSPISSLYLSIPAQNLWKPQLCPLPSRSPGGCWRRVLGLGGGSGWVVGGQHRAHSASRCSLGVRAAPPPSARSPHVNPHPTVPTVAALGRHWPAAFLPAPPSPEWAPQALPSSRLLFIAVFLPEPGDVL